MFSTARPMPFGLPAPWVRQYDESTQTWIFVNPTTSPPIISHSHPGFAQSVFYDSEDEEDQDSIEEMSDVAESSSSSSSFSSSHAVPVLSYDASEEDTAPFARVSGPRRRRNAGTAAIALLEKLEMEGQVKDRWLRLKRDRGRKEARTIVVSMMFSHSDDDKSSSFVLHELPSNQISQFSADVASQGPEKRRRKSRGWMPSLRGIAAPPAAVRIEVS